MAKKKPGSYHHGDLKRALLDAALEIIDENGIDRFTLSAAARRVGVSVAAPYRHFADKDALVNELAVDAFRALRDATVAAVVAAEPEPSRQVQAAGIAFVKFAWAEAARFRTMFSLGYGDSATGGSLQSAYEEIHAPMRSVVRTVREGGELDPDDPVVVAVAARALVYGLARMFTEGPGQVAELPEDQFDKIAFAVTEVLRRASADREVYPPPGGPADGDA